ncbi:MAG: sodium/proline symporter [Planctomycetes bacterium]|nr:sodium/proline symporter [Planctomycetota bacterium]
MVWVFLLYLAVLLLIGFVSERYTRGQAGFLLGDRKMGPWVTALSYESTAYSGWLMLGFPGRAFTRGLVALWVGLSCVLGDALNWILVSHRLREETGKLRALTVPQYLESRFPKANGHAVRVVASLAITFFMLIYLWSQFVAAGKAIRTMLEWEYVPAVLLSAAVIVLYTFQGGYRAVVWTDAFQAVMMLIALLLLPAVCLVHIGGWPGLMAGLERASVEAKDAGPTLVETSSFLGTAFAGLAGLSLFAFLFEDAGVGAGYLGQPHICVRYMAIRDARELRPAFVVSIVFAVLVCTGAVAVGLVAHHWFRFKEVAAGADDSRLPLPDPEEVLPQLARLVLPPWLAGLVVSAIMAAIMSTASGFLLSVTSSLSEDIYHRILRPRAGQKELVYVSRLVTLGLGLGALLLALATDPLDPKSTVYKLVLYGWGGLAGCFSAPVVLALFWSRMTRAGCLAGMVVGALAVLLWRNGSALIGPAAPDWPRWVFSLYEVIPAMILSALAVFFVSLFTKNGTRRHTDYADLRG